MFYYYNTYFSLEPLNSLNELFFLIFHWRDVFLDVGCIVATLTQLFWLFMDLLELCDQCFILEQNMHNMNSVISVSYCNRTCMTWTLWSVSRIVTEHVRHELCDQCFILEQNMYDMNSVISVSYWNRTCMIWTLWSVSHIVTEHVRHELCDQCLIL